MQILEPDESIDPENALAEALEDSKELIEGIGGRDDINARKLNYDTVIVTSEGYNVELTDDKVRVRRYEEENIGPIADIFLNSLMDAYDIEQHSLEERSGGY